MAGDSREERAVACRSRSPRGVQTVPQHADECLEAKQDVTASVDATVESVENAAAAGDVQTAAMAANVDMGNNRGNKCAPDAYDDIVHFDWHEGMMLDSRYKLERLLGDGAFGRVVLAKDQKDKQEVAIKIIRDVKRYVEHAKVEAAILDDIRKADADGSSRCVIMHSSFTHSSTYFCMVFEPLGQSLYDFLKWNGFRGFWLQDIQSFAKQSLQALNFLHTRLQCTHTDLKPENILLESAEVARVSFFPRAEFQPPCEEYARLPYVRPASNSIKLIDFGNATYIDMHHAKVISTRQYRAPEVILQMEWSEHADIWSLSCILMELYRGQLLFETHDSLEHLALMEQILGPFPLAMLARAGSKAKKKYITASVDGLKWPDAAPTEESVWHVAHQWRLSELAPPEHLAFTNFIGSLLTAEPARRPDATQALEDPFLSLTFNE
mmetsp:Transcript_121848/g.235027  ORF Transcript_121848/g.235027 Transcript_121848/m.235027 type:complete len:439 (+) Transcript_121848:58-1374(+)